MNTKGKVPGGKESPHPSVDRGDPEHPHPGEADDEERCNPKKLAVRKNGDVNGSVRGYYLL